MDWISYKESGFFWAFYAVQRTGHLSSQLAHPDEIDYAANELKRQIDVAAKRMKLELQKPPRPLFGDRDAKGS